MRQKDKLYKKPIKEMDSKKNQEIKLTKSFETKS